MSRIIRRFRKNKEETKNKINKAKSTTLKLALIMLNFIFATFAWFTYTKILNPAVDVNVSAWQVDFKDSTGVLGTSMQFEVGNFYPGMNDFTKTIEIFNLGDRPASIEYQIDELYILGQPYVIKSAPEEGDEQETLYKSETIDETTGKKVIKLLNDSTKYPFEIILTHSQEINIASSENTNQNKGSFEICFTWPYEITTIPEVLPDDLQELIDNSEEEITDEQILQELNERKNALDTQWGFNIAAFYESQEDSNAQGIEIKLKAIAKQII